MKKILIAGGTVFVSRYVAEYYVKKGYRVYVLNRNHHQQSNGVILIEGDRHQLGDLLRYEYFDVIFDINAYNGKDILDLLNAVENFDDYIFISSSAVYPEYCQQPFCEETPLGENQFWKDYGTDKIKAEKALIEKVPHAYIIRPPYLYGPMNNVYREALVFDCALQKRKFYLPGDGQMNLQFFHVHDLCRFMDILLKERPSQHIYNVGNEKLISVKDWVSLCYQIVGVDPEFVYVYENLNQRHYFSFYDYEYQLDVTKQYQLINQTISLEKGLKDSYEWYIKNKHLVNKKPYIEFIDNYFTNRLFI